MADTNCLTASMLEVGMRHQTSLSFSREQVDQYCNLSGDRNAIHRDPEAARLRFPDVDDIIVPGGLIQISVSALFGTELPGDGTVGLTFTPERMRRPICPGDKLLVTLEVTKVRGAIAEVNVSLQDEEGQPVSAAKAKLIAPDDDYRRWWEVQND